MLTDHIAKKHVIAGSETSSELEEARPGPANAAVMEPEEYEGMNVFGVMEQEGAAPSFHCSDNTYRFIFYFYFLNFRRSERQLLLGKVQK